MTGKENQRDWSMKDQNMIKEKSLKTMILDQGFNESKNKTGLFYSKYFVDGENIIVFVDLRDFPFSVYPKREEDFGPVELPQKPGVIEVQELVNNKNKKIRSKLEKIKNGATLDKWGE